VDSRVLVGGYEGVRNNRGKADQTAGWLSRRFDREIGWEGLCCGGHGAVVEIFHVSSPCIRIDLVPTPCFTAQISWVTWRMSPNYFSEGPDADPA
jgi:hypothetical protein